MKAKHGNEVVEAWQIVENVHHAWVAHYFDIGRIYWQLELGNMILVVRQYRILNLGQIGDYLIYNGEDVALVPQKIIYVWFYRDRSGLIRVHSVWKRHYQHLENSK